MTWPLVILRVPLAAYLLIEAALAKSGDEGLLRIDSPSPGHLNLDGVVLEPDPSTLDIKVWPCCGHPIAEGHNSSCTFYGLDKS